MVKCGGLNENKPHRCRCLDVWAQVGGPVWEGLGGVWPCLRSCGLFVKGVSVGMGFEVSKILHFQCLSLTPASRPACRLSAAPYSHAFALH